MPRKSRAKFKAGDRVRIVGPMFFIRCGYPLQTIDMADAVWKEDMPKIEVFLKDLGYNESSGYWSKMQVGIAQQLAYGRLRKAGFGGK